MENKPGNPKRRSFLLALGVGGAGAAAAVVSSTVAVPAKPAGSATAQAGSGYTESAHIANYYRSTRV